MKKTSANDDFERAAQQILYGIDPVLDWDPLFQVIDKDPVLMAAHHSSTPSHENGPLAKKGPTTTSQGEIKEPVLHGMAHDTDSPSSTPSSFGVKSTQTIRLAQTHSVGTRNIVAVDPTATRQKEEPVKKLDDAESRDPQAIVAHANALRSHAQTMNTQTAFQQPPSPIPMGGTKRAAQTEQSASAKRQKIYTSQLSISHIRLGQGGGTVAHRGNVEYLRLMRYFKAKFFFTKRSERGKITDEFLDLLSALDMKFVEPKGKDAWGEVKDNKDKKIKDKVTNALREHWTAGKKSVINKNDVVLGLGYAAASYHPGNGRLYALAQEIKEKNQKGAERQDPQALIQELMNEVESPDRKSYIFDEEAKQWTENTDAEANAESGRFVEFNVETKKWRKVDTRRAEKACLQVLSISSKDVVLEGDAYVKGNLHPGNRKLDSFAAQVNGPNPANELKTTIETLGGRFLEYDESQKEWIPVEDRLALKACSKALEDAAEREPLYCQLVQQWNHE
eukprot:scaffold2234_cov165-Amphora_coffeaeformis.AAC.2